LCRRRHRLTSLLHAAIGRVVLRDVDFKTVSTTNTDRRLTMADIEVLAEWSGTGDYDMRCETRVVRRNDKFYVVDDEYCGEGQLRGGAYRPHVYEIAPHLVERVVDLVKNGHESDMDEEFRGNAFKIQTLEREILTRAFDSGPDVKYLGEQGHLKWTSEL
jgi:hypothetical protein